MDLTIQIHNVKNIEDLEITLTTTPGIYAITGENGTGKSTLLACATFTFNRFTDLTNFLGAPQKNAYIKYNYSGASTKLNEKNGRWKQEAKIASVIRKVFGNPLRGFLEGSISFGNRFKTVAFSDFPSYDYLAQYAREEAPEFVKEGMGLILQNDTHYYDDLTFSRAVEIHGSKKDVYFYTREGQEVDQFHMSTGENLLASVLGALHSKNKRQQKENYPCMIYFDEIEFGLHPAALKRLVNYFKTISQQYNYAIYFSTHSLEIINEISDENIYYLRKKDKSLTKAKIEVVTPCAPAYATNMIYNHHGFDDIIIVEDEKARKIVKYIITQENIVNNRLVNIIHAGGWREVMQRGSEWKTNNAFGNNPKILAILDRDCETELLNYLMDHPDCNGIPYGFLPIDSVEKYLYRNLYLTVDSNLELAINRTIFLDNDIRSVVRTYSPSTPPNKNDNNGKNLYRLLTRHLQRESKVEDDLINFTIDYVKNTAEYIALRDFIRNNL